MMMNLSGDSKTNIDKKHVNLITPKRLSTTSPANTLESAVQDGAKSKNASPANPKTSIEKKPVNSITPKRLNPFEAAALAKDKTNLENSSPNPKINCKKAPINTIAVKRVPSSTTASPSTKEDNPLGFKPTQPTLIVDLTENE